MWPILVAFRGISKKRNSITNIGGKKEEEEEYKFKELSSFKGSERNLNFDLRVSSIHSKVLITSKTRAPK